MTALQGIKVLDLSRILAGPYCTQMLSDLGATVWKIEAPWGDDTRRWGPPFVQGESAYYLSTNRGKKSVAIDMREARGQRLLRGLAEQADVLVENFKPGDLARYGLDFLSVQPLNPRLVYVSITGFGPTGPRSGELGVDAVLQAMTGIMSVTGEHGGPPAKVGVAWIDLLTGMTAAVGVLAALRERETSNHGQYVDVSLFDVGLASMVNLAQSYLATGTPPRPMGTAQPQIAPYQAFQASDGWFFLAVVNDEQYRRMCHAVGGADLLGPRFRTNPERVEHREELAASLSGVFRAGRRDVWLAALRRARVPAAPVYDLAEAIADPQAAARGALWEVAHPTIGPLPTMASPLRHMGRTPAEPQGHPPLLGEHTSEVLVETFGLSASELADMQASDVIRCTPAVSHSAT